MIIKGNDVTRLRQLIRYAKVGLFLLTHKYHALTRFRHMITIERHKKGLSKENKVPSLVVNTMDRLYNNIM